MTTVNKKILIIGPLPDPITGISLANRIVRDGLTARDGFEVETINTSYNSFDEKLGKFSFSKAFYYLKLQTSFVKVFNNDIIYITPGQTFLGMLKYAPFIWAASLSRKRVIQHLNGNFLGRQYEQLKGWRKALFYHLVVKTDKAIVLSESLRKNYTHFLPEERIHNLANCVEDELFELRDRVDQKEYGKLRIVYLSNLMPEKGILELLDALKMLEDNNVPYNARLAGNIAPENKALILDKLRLLPNTTYLGVVDTLGKRDLLLWSNTFVLPTYYTMEGQPFSILESMSLGNAVVTTAHAGIPDVFVDGVNGRFVVKKNPRSLAHALMSFEENPEKLKSIGLHNAEEAYQKYTVSNFINQLVRIIED